MIVFSVQKKKIFLQISGYRNTIAPASEVITHTQSNRKIFLSAIN